MVIMTNESVRCVSSISGATSIIKYWLNTLMQGMVPHVGHWMQFEPARVESVDAGGD
jgi:hypothetical protein